MNNLRRYLSHIRSAGETSRNMEAEHSAGIKAADTGAVYPGENINGDVLSACGANWTALTSPSRYGLKQENGPGEHPSQLGGRQHFGPDFYISKVWTHLFM